MNGNKRYNIVICTTCESSKNVKLAPSIGYYCTGHKIYEMERYVEKNVYLIYG